MTKDLWHVSVLIPARDEEDLLPRCLESVLNARGALRGRGTCDVIVAVDRSMDSTFAIAQRMLRGVGSVIRIEAGIVGVARAMAARTALREREDSTSRTWLANTDADCCVPPQWLTDQLKFAESGAEAVAGVIDVDSFEEHDEMVPQRFRSTYLLHPDGTHPHVHGANFGVRADAYLRAGGWADLRTAEDHDLWARLEACGARRLSPSCLRVLTSGRRVGRAPLGFAGALSAHNEVALEA
jgi:cellulose synthase/poly-beta-1,6-N-acetylglucosamine synthase-like glycosyltransferase